MENVFEFGGTKLQYGFAGKQQVKIEGRKISIIKGGFVNKIGLRGGEKTFDITHVSTIQIKKNGILPGYLQFGITGSPDTAQGFGTYGNENSLITDVTHRQP